MISYVLDTNVIVSGLLSPSGPPGRFIDALLARKLYIVVDDRILQEYNEVLMRPKFHFDPYKIKLFFRIMQFQIHVVAPPMRGLSASDSDDTKFLEVAMISKNRTLVTGNAKHYPKNNRGSVRVLSPTEAWEAFYE